MTSGLRRRIAQYDPPARRGRLIAVEGLDGTGKTTLSRALASALGARWTTTPGPGLRGVRGTLEAAFVGVPRARSVFYASTVLAVSERVDVHLASGRDLVVDRYWLSTWAYGQLGAEPPPLDALEAVVRPADVTVFVDAADEVRATRIERRGASSLDIATLDVDASRRLREAYARGLSRPVAGTVLTIDTTHRSPVDALVVTSRALAAAGVAGAA